MTISQLSKVNSHQSWRHPSSARRSGASPFGGGQRNYSLSNKYQKPRQKHGIIRRGIRFLAPFILLAIVLSGLSLIGLFAWIAKDLPTPDGVINRSITVSTKIYDREGQTVLYDIHGNIKRTLTTLDKIPPHVISATLAAEDRDFYKHKGFSLTGIVRSVLKNLVTGSRVGGSTLTQQFVKNAVLTNEKTYTRKLKEFLVSYRIEKKFSKEEILQMYFNEIPFGSVIYGVEAAAQTFFGKSASDLTIAEGAVIAAIPRAPTFYSPYGNNLDRLIGRQRYIIDSMVELNYISSAESEVAKQEKIVFKPSGESMIAPHFVMYIKELLSEKYGEEFINQEGLKVYTSLDLEKQKIAEKAVENGIKANGEKYEFANASLVAIDARTGQILAMVGSADYFNNDIDGQVNVSLRPRQPGSSFKPIVYAAAFIKGYTPNTIIYDTVTDFDTTQEKPYQPHNYDLKERGPVTIRRALAGSLNIPAVKTTYLTGINNVLDLAEKLGYTTLGERSRFGLSLVLGGGEVKLLEHVSAFAALAQDGVKHDVNPILKIEDKNGRVIYEYQDKNQEIINPEIARQVTDILADDSARAYIFGLNGKLTLPDRPVAAKTGTTNDYHDAWTVGYTPDLAAGVWVGNSDNKEMKRGADGSIIAAPIWNEFMVEALKNSAVTNFTKPAEVVTGKPVLDGQETIEIKVKIDTMSGKLATEYTPESTIKEIAVKEVHDILHYINKDDPRGSAPVDPSLDQQYQNWEDSAIRWAKEQGFDPNSNQNIPTDYDHIHLSADQPILTIVSPLPNQTISDGYITVEIAAHSRRGVRKVEYYLNQKLVVTKTDTSNTFLDFSDLESGYHNLTVKVKDDLENTAVKSIELNLILPQSSPTINWLLPGGSSVIKLPANLEMTVNRWEKIRKIDFYLVDKNSRMEKYAGFVEPKDSTAVLVLAKKFNPGSYTVRGTIFSRSGKEYKTEELDLEIIE